MIVGMGRERCLEGKVMFFFLGICLESRGVLGGRGGRVEVKC